jgi:hypothetical protein
MKATQFMSRPFIVAGCQVTEHNMAAIAKWCQGYVITDAEKPFVRVPVNRPTNQRQTQAFVGSWVLLSTLRGEPSFKVYSVESLEKSFIPLAEVVNLPEMDEPIDIPEVEEVEPGKTDSVVAHDRVGSNVRALPVQGGTKAPVQFRSAT